MHKRGDVRTKVIVIAIAAFVLAMLFFGGIPFLIEQTKKLRDFASSGNGDYASASAKGAEYIRYNILNGEVQWHDSIDWRNFEQQDANGDKYVELKGKKIDEVELRRDFYSVSIFPYLYESEKLLIDLGNKYGSLRILEEVSGGEEANLRGGLDKNLRNYILFNYGMKSYVLNEEGKLYGKPQSTKERIKIGDIIPAKTKTNNIIYSIIINGAIPDTSLQYEKEILDRLKFQIISSEMVNIILEGSQKEIKLFNNLLPDKNYISGSDIYLYLIDKEINDATRNFVKLRYRLGFGSFLTDFYIDFTTKQYPINLVLAEIFFDMSDNNKYIFIEPKNYNDAERIFFEAIEKWKNENIAKKPISIEYSMRDNNGVWVEKTPIEFFCVKKHDNKYLVVDLSKEVKENVVCG